MESPALRPSLTLRLTPDREKAIEHIRARLSERVPERWVGKGRWAEIHVPGVERRIWSPHLSLRIDSPEDGEDGCRLHARFAPRPEIWTGIVFLYGALVFFSVLGAVFGWVQLASDEPAWGLWAPAIGIPGILAIHGAALVGRRLSREQMLELRGILQETVAEIRADR